MSGTTDAWAQVQAMSVGASQRTSGQHHHDQREYGTALQQENYPNIAQWCSGNWTEENIQECLRLFRDAIARGSRPLLQVGILATEGRTVRGLIWSNLTDKEKQKARQMIAILQSVLG